MDIYEYAEKNPYADYLDMHDGCIYKIPQYIEERKTNPDARILVVDSLDGTPIGYAKKSQFKDWF